MKIHQFGDPTKPAMLLLHGLLCPWQIWEPHIRAFQENYCVSAIALNAHTAEEPSEFISLENEAEQIEWVCRAAGIERISALCGLSLGGNIAYTLWKRGKIRIDSLVMDGAPLLPLPSFAVSFMLNSYTRLLRKSRERDPQTLEQCQKDFLPAQYLEEYLKIADTITDTSMQKLLEAAFSGPMDSFGAQDTRVLYLHGTKGNEALSKKSAAKLKKELPAAQVICYKGDPHIYKAIYQPEQWIADVRAFLNSSSQ